MIKNTIEDTIAAISTPLGAGGIGIIRVSGSDAFNIAKKLFKPAKDMNWLHGKTHRLIYGYVYDPASQKLVDEILLGVMRAPHTFTKEDVVEFNCHGGIVPLRKTLDLLLKYGARAAEPGEFTKRAFLNGRLDMAQAESIVDIIRAKTEAGLDVALNQLQGKLSVQVREIQANLLDVLAHIEVSIDFSEDELGADSMIELRQKIERSIEDLKKLLKGAGVGKIYREGIHTVIAGKPNVGKSSLLNALLKDKRAIVTEIPGTTRDTIEEVLNIRGIPLRLVDTAGLRHTDDLVERMGVERSKQLVRQAELVLFVLDAAGRIGDEDKEILSLVQDKKGIVILNKIDLLKNKVPGRADDQMDDREIRKRLPGWVLVEISALKEEGLAELEKKIEEVVLGGGVTAADHFLVSKARHKDALLKTVDYLNDALLGMDEKLPVDLLAIDVREAWAALGEITGESVAEDLIDKIFSDFCVGK